MARLEELTQGAAVRGVRPDGAVTVVNVQWYGSDVVKQTYKDPSGRVAAGITTHFLHPTDLAHSR